MDNTTITLQDNSNCLGSFQVSSDNFAVYQNEIKSVSDNNTTFVKPFDNLSNSTSYKIRVSTDVKDLSGKKLTSQFETSDGFTTISKTFIVLGVLNDLYFC